MSRVDRIEDILPEYNDPSWMEFQATMWYPHLSTNSLRAFGLEPQEETPNKPADAVLDSVWEVFEPTKPKKDSNRKRIDEETDEKN